MSIEPYNEVLKDLSLATSSDTVFDSLDDVMSFTDSAYLVDGLVSLRQIPQNSVNFVFSNAVLEHVRLHEFEDTIRALFKLQTPGGVASHTIDLKDHLAHSLNSLRFSQRLWESDLFSRSGFYTNRLRARQIVEIFEIAGYEVLEQRPKKWDGMPLPTKKLHKDYADLPQDDLLTKGLDITMRKPL